MSAFGAFARLLRLIFPSGAHPISVSRLIRLDRPAPGPNGYYFVPELGEGAEILEGSSEEIAEKLIEILKAKGGIK